MFNKTILGLLAGAVATITFGAVGAHAGSEAPEPVPTLNIAATTPTEIFVGESVSFSFTYSCTYSWSDGSLQPFDESGNRGNAITLDNPILFDNAVRSQGPGPSDFPDSGTFSLTFSTAGTYNIDARVSATFVVYGALADTVDSMGIPSCDISNATSTVSVIVRDRPTTTVAPTTTIAPTTTKKEKEKVLPATGSDNTGLFIAVGTAFAGVTILISRRRLLTK